MIDAEPPERDAGRHGDQKTREHLHPHETLDLQVDVVEDLHRDLLLRERAAADLDEFALVEISGHEKEVDEKQHEHELSGETRARPTPPDQR